jgi:hypothetical protein
MMRATGHWQLQVSPIHAAGSLRVHWQLEGTLRAVRLRRSMGRCQWRQWQALWQHERSGLWLRVGAGYSESDVSTPNRQWPLSPVVPTGLAWCANDPKSNVANNPASGHRQRRLPPRPAAPSAVRNHQCADVLCMTGTGPGNEHRAVSRAWSCPALAHMRAAAHLPVREHLRVRRGSGQCAAATATQHRTAGRPCARITPPSRA